MATEQSIIDRPKEVRDRDGVDLEALATYLSEQAPELGVERAADLELKQFPGGFSNLTYLVRHVPTDVEWVLRRPPLGLEIKTAHDMGREWRVLTALQGHFEKIPDPILHCEDESVLGGEFYLMERVTGVILRQGNVPDRFLNDAATMEQVAEATVRTLSEIHAVDLDATGLRSSGKPEGYVVRQVEGWIKRYRNAETDDIEAMQQVAGWLQDHMPDGEIDHTLIHNDFKYDNVVLDADTPSRIKAVLDWEMATVGDPLMDFGTTLSLWTEPSDPDEFRMFAFGPTTLPGNPDRRQVVDWYAQASGRDLDADQMLFYFVYGLYKMAVILQQIYKRYTLGHSKDPRFAALIHGVKAYADLAVRAIHSQRIDDLG